MKLRQKLTLGLCAFYLITMIGFALNMHFCGGKLSEIRWIETASCSACKASEKKQLSGDCCKDKSVEAKIKDSHQVGSKVKLPMDFSLEMFFSPMIAEVFRQLLPTLFSSVENKAPPLSSILSLHAFNCVFRN
ncbi:hypothetical protein QG516_14625 [Pedobacter gandavensis]|uniref:HYC_CC_PP family protein n=1 Tax=Pedobacter TaxID=84567 RepID=UPI001C99A580|nr:MULTISPECIES: hypothetical protein [Pedobacter]WGQ07795.1 hypothetical protein QG516_14625 [Pedobacter gandavensis]